jgi:hypothetical protein
MIFAEQHTRAEQHARKEEKSECAVDLSIACAIL